MADNFEWHLYNGLAGDPYLLLVVTLNGGRENELFNRNLPFYNWRLQRKINKLRRRLESR